MAKYQKNDSMKNAYKKPVVVRSGKAEASGACPKCTEGNCGIAYRTGW
jgi:hypothetical protein